MQLSVTLAQSDKKPLLRFLLQEYLAELSQFGEVDQHYPYFDSYWDDSQRWPYLIEINDQLAGFALVNSWSPSGQGTDFAIAEFYILPRFRKSGIGSRAFAALLGNHPGIWELSVMSCNEAAAIFWRHALNAADVVNVERVRLNDETVYRFETSGRP